MDWWKRYFKEAWEPIQHLYKLPEETQTEAFCIANIMHEKAYTSVLDVPCGYGRMCLALAKQGFEVSGIEYNIEAVQHGNNLAQEMGLSVSLQQGDMRYINMPQQFDVGLCLFNSFGYFNDAENKQYLEQMSKAIRKGGMFLLECHVLETVLPAFTPSSLWRLSDEVLIAEERQYDFSQSRLNSNWTVIRSQQQAYYQSSVRMYSYRELCDLLTQCGFGNIKAYRNLEREELEMGDDTMVLMATKMV